MQDTDCGSQKYWKALERWKNSVGINLYNVWRAVKMETANYIFHVDTLPVLLLNMLQ